MYSRYKSVYGPEWFIIYFCILATPFHIFSFSKLIKLHYQFNVPCWITQDVYSFFIPSLFFSHMCIPTCTAYTYMDYGLDLILISIMWLEQIQYLPKCGLATQNNHLFFTSLLKKIHNIDSEESSLIFPFSENIFMSFSIWMEWKSKDIEFYIRLSMKFC